MAIPSAINPKIMDKNIFPIHLMVLQICRNNISFSLEKAHSSERKLGSSKILFLAIEKINLRHQNKQMRTYIYKPEFVFTCCHYWLFRKSVSVFDEKQYDFNNPIVANALSENTDIKWLCMLMC